MAHNPAGYTPPQRRQPSTTFTLKFWNAVTEHAETMRVRSQTVHGAFSRGSERMHDWALNWTECEVSVKGQQVAVYDR